jgi:hypothetical protein
MAIPVNLQKFKSSGVYILEFDKSQILTGTTGVLRLIIGFSKKGPFNTPVFVPTVEFFKDIFGEVDKTLERRGSFFHRSCLTALERGPILVLNLLKTDDNLDKTEFRPISLCSTIPNLNEALAPISKYFNTDKFWFIDPVQLQNVVRDYHPSGTPALFSIANVGRKPISVLMRKSDQSGRTRLGLDVLAKEWYGTGNVPTFMSENDFISDYLIDIFVLEGDFSDYNALRLDPIFGRFFDARGLLKNIVDGFGTVRNGIDEFVNSGLVPVLGRFTGVLIPDFVNKSGENLYIETLVNREVQRTGLLINLDSSKFDDEYLTGNLIDLIGHTIESEEPTTIDFLSYFGNVVDLLDYNENANFDIDLFDLIAESSTIIPNSVNGYLSASTALTSLSTYSANRYDTIKILGPNHPDVLNNLATSFFATQEDFDAYINKISTDSTFISNIQPELNSLLVSFIATKIHIAEVLPSSDNLTSNAFDKLTIRISLEDEIVGGIRTVNGQYYYVFAPTNTAINVECIPSFNPLFRTSTSPNRMFAGQWNDVYRAAVNGVLTDGDAILSDIVTPTYDPITFTYATDNNFVSLGVSNGDGFSKLVGYVLVNAFTDETFLTPKNVETLLTTGFAQRRFKTLAGALNESLQISSQVEPNKIVFDNSALGPFGLNGFNGKIKVGDYLIASFSNGTTKIDPLTNKTRLTRVLSVSENRNPLSVDYKKITVITVDPVFVDNLRVERYKTIEDFVTNYKFTALNGYTLRADQMPNKTGIRMNEILDVMYDTNIATSLADKNTIDFRYIVDTFNHGIEPSAKSRLSRLAKNRGNAFAILNMPSLEEFKSSVDPLFKFSTTSNYDPIYISTGGNLNLNPNNILTLPSIEDGANYCGFFGPNLLFRDSGVNISIPPAAHISNLFIDKYTRDLPYSVVAGPRRGVIAGAGVVGVEYAFTRLQLDEIEPSGFNTIINLKGSGLTINSNQTAQQNIKSALSNIHVRELLIFIQDGVTNILSNYRWEFNTAQNRLEIKTLVDGFLSSILNNQGLYNYTTVMDSTNNTNEIIDNNLGVIDIFVEPVRATGILVAQYTILKTGDISAGQFTLPS